MKKKRLIQLTFALMLFSALFARLAFSDCPPRVDTPREFRFYLRGIDLDYLADPAGGEYDSQDIQDLMLFYSSRKSVPALQDCEVKMGLTRPRMVDILQKSVIFKTECSDAIDNDKDGKIDMADAGCTESVDNDETNCGDNACEGYEACLSCTADCGGCLTAGIFGAKGPASKAISFNEKGDVLLRGSLSSNTAPAPSADDEFIIKDGTCSAIAVISLATGNMQVKGSVFQGQSSLNPLLSSSNFIVKNSNGQINSYIDNSGNF